MIWIAVAIVTPFITFVVGFYLGKREGIRTEKYVWESRIKTNYIPYSGLFYEDEPSEKAKYPPLVIKVKKNGRWGPKK
jgi:hypothetical protein